MELLAGAVWLAVFIVIVMLAVRIIDYLLIAYPLRRVFYDR